MGIYVDIEKNLPGFALRVKLEADRETLALLGPSGCGKSMTLRCIAGIERPDRGSIVLNGVTLFDSGKGICLSPQKRRTGLMLQNYALFPNMTVRGNVEAGARREKDKKARGQRVDAALAAFGLEGLAGHYPHQLSGGQQQRTALARILVSDPAVLLLDEPFSALDSHLRLQLEGEIRRVIRDFQGPVILVSHDREEVYRLSDRVAVMAGGRIETAGDKREIFRRPRTRAAALLTGCRNLSRSVPLPDGRCGAVDWGLTLKLPQGECPGKYIGIRMEDIKPGEGPNAVLCDVVDALENPRSVVVMLRPCSAPDAAPLAWRLDTAQWEKLRGGAVTVRLPPESLMLLEE